MGEKRAKGNVRERVWTEEWERGGEVRAEGKERGRMGGEGRGRGGMGRKR